jgi:predicted DNA-binding protein
MTAHAFARSTYTGGIRLDPSRDSSSSELSTSTGSTEVTHLQELLQEGLDDLEDANLGIAAWHSHRRSGEPTISLDQVMGNLGLDVGAGMPWLISRSR